MNEKNNKRREKSRRHKIIINTTKSFDAIIISFAYNISNYIKNNTQRKRIHKLIQTKESNKNKITQQRMTK